MPHYLEPYRRSALRYGSDFGVTLWATPQSQQVRFEVFAQMCQLAGKRVLDAGCSRGDLAEFLIKQGVAFSRYIGVDAIDEVIRFAGSRNLPRCEFHAGDVLARPDLLGIGSPQVICLSGTLNTMTDADVLALLESAWAASGEVLLFNFLSDAAGPSAVPQNQTARRLDTMMLLAWAFDKTWNVAYRQDYFEHGHDGTIAMRKP